jgi:methylated-DNA-[protein]-cysteine S-methyltransferase
MAAAPPTELHTAALDTPLGTMLIFATASGVCLTTFREAAEAEAELARRFGGDGAIVFAPAADPHGACTALRDYLGGALDALDDVPVDLGGTPFQREVWARLRRIRAGKTSTYGRLAAEMGRPTAMRAVGAANGQNPVGVIVPCHRVIASDGKLQGYASGLERKRWLLVHERALLA